MCHFRRETFAIFGNCFCCAFGVYDDDDALVAADAEQNNDGELAADSYAGRFMAQSLMDYALVLILAGH